MKTVLIVNDDVIFLKSLEEWLDISAGQLSDFKVVTVANDKKAMAYISSRPVDLVGSDLKMTCLDVFELLGRTLSHDSEDGHDCQPHSGYGGQIEYRGRIIRS